MLFNSADFLIFFPIVFLLYLVMPRRLRAVWLLVCSYYFYMCWNAAYIVLIVFTTLITYAAALGIEKARSSAPSGAPSGASAGTPPSCAESVDGHSAAEQDVAGTGTAAPRGQTPSGTESSRDNGRSPRARLWLSIAIISNLIILFIFKYSDFAIENINSILAFVRIQVISNPFDVILPVGISFYTFQTFSYVIDVYRGITDAEHNLIYYALFASYFPQLVAGPIERSESLLRQLHELPKRPLVSLDKASSGFCMMLWGLFMKMVIADRISLFVDGVWESLYACGTVETVLAAIGFAIQIYCDFGGYSAIAIGASRIMGIELMENFNTPYFARSIADFWRRWHISLSSWMRDYIYIPLGGSRCSKVRRYLNLMITFLVSGLWHGASWTYVFWGALHGFYQILGDLLLPLRRRLYGAEGSLRPASKPDRALPADKSGLKEETPRDDAPARSTRTDSARPSGKGTCAAPAAGASSARGPLIAVNRSAFSYRLGQAALTFALTTFAWIFFRAETMADAIYYLSRMFTRFNPWVLFNDSLYAFGLDEKESGIFFAALLLLLAIDLLRYVKHMDLGTFLITQNLCFRWFVMFALAAAVLVYGEYGINFSSTQFIYFAF